jgi:hypothetical protein
MKISDLQIVIDINIFYPITTFSKNIPQDIINGSINFSSSGNNSLINTNNLKSSIINNLNFLGDNIISNSGLKNNFNIYLKNLNTIGKKALSTKRNQEWN